MKLLIMNKETNQEVIYEDAIGYATQRDAETENGIEPAFTIFFPDYSTATYRKSEWDLFVLKRTQAETGSNPRPPEPPHRC